MERICITGENLQVEETPGDAIDWRPMDEQPIGYGYYKVKMRVHGEVIVGYSTWTGYQWVNCFPVQERLGWSQ